MERVEFEIGSMAAAARYGLLTRLRAAADARGVAVLGFALGDDARLLLEGPARAVGDAVTAVKVGTVRSRGGPRSLGETRRTRVDDALAELVALHRSADADGPLASPWTSHRDLLGFRVAPFFDRRVWAGRIDARLVHLRAGGGPLPRGWPPSLELAPRDLSLILRVSGAVLGVLPADRACFRLFTHVSRATGIRQIDAADALGLTPRRLRQLGAEPEPLLPVALTALGDARLRVVP